MFLSAETRTELTNEYTVLKKSVESLNLSLNNSQIKRFKLFIHNKLTRFNFSKALRPVYHQRTNVSKTTKRLQPSGQDKSLKTKKVTIDSEDKSALWKILKKLSFFLSSLIRPNPPLQSISPSTTCSSLSPKTSLISTSFCLSVPLRPLSGSCN